MLITLKKKKTFGVEFKNPTYAIMLTCRCNDKEQLEVVPHQTQKNKKKSLM
jgi:hypothetical protein